MPLCSPDDATQRPPQAEALRERAILSGEFPAPLDRAAKFIRELTTQRIAEVRRLVLAP